MRPLKLLFATILSAISVHADRYYLELDFLDDHVIQDQYETPPWPCQRIEGGARGLKEVKWQSSRVAAGGQTTGFRLYEGNNCDDHHYLTQKSLKRKSYDYDTHTATFAVGRNIGSYAVIWIPNFREIHWNDVVAWHEENPWKPYPFGLDNNWKSFEVQRDECHRGVDPVGCPPEMYPNEHGPFAWDYTWPESPRGS